MGPTDYAPPRRPHPRWRQVQPQRHLLGPPPRGWVLIQLPRLRVQGTVRHTNSHCQAASQAESLTVGPGALPHCPRPPSTLLALPCT